MIASDDDTRKDYSVGYKRPPLKSRFQEGQSGNPKGKSKGQQSFKSELAQELKSRVPVTENGRKQFLSKQTIIVKRMVSDAAKGDARAREQLLRLLSDIERTQPIQSADDPIGSAKDAAILAQFKHDLLRTLAIERDDGSDEKR